MNQALKNFLSAPINALVGALVEASIKCAKDEIICDARNGVIPRDAKDLSELHDYVDANMYGGAGVILFLLDRDENSDEDLDFSTEVMNKVSDEIDKWIKAGGIKDEVKPRGLRAKGPRHDHDCDICIFLGQYETKYSQEQEHSHYDLYACMKSSIPTVIARWGSNGPDYTSGLETAKAVLGGERPISLTTGLKTDWSEGALALAEALRRARRKGLPI